jgi:hypothetical protein
MNSLPHPTNEVNPMSDASTPAPKTYNGWTNYETWNVALWMDNEPGTYEDAREKARDAYRDVEVPSYMLTICTPREWAARQLADTLKDEYEEASCEMVPQGTVWADLIGAALSEVNWREIAENLIDEVANGIDAEEAEDEPEDEDAAEGESDGEDF